MCTMLVTLTLFANLEGRDSHLSTATAPVQVLGSLNVRCFDFFLLFLPLIFSISSIFSGNGI